MIYENELKVGDVILYKRKNKIKKWNIINIAPSGKYAEIRNDDWSERWIYFGDILEIVESAELEVSPEVATALETSGLARWSNDREAKNKK